MPMLINILANKIKKALGLGFMETYIYKNAIFYCDINTTTTTTSKNNKKKSIIVINYNKLLKKMLKKCF